MVIFQSLLQEFELEGSIHCAAGFISCGGRAS